MIAWTLGALRWLQVSSTVVVCGSSLFFLYGYSPEVAGDTDADAGASWPRLLLLTTLATGVASALGWLLAEAAVLTGTWSAWHDVVSGTRLGRVLLLRAGLLALALIACATLRAKRLPWAIVGGLGVISVASFAWTGHGNIGSGAAASLHLWADVLHLLSAAVWIGALLPLSIAVTRALRSTSCADSRRIAHALARFSAIGPAVVALLLLSGFANSWFLLGRHLWRALHSAYGLTLLAKLVLFGVMLALAAMHRYRTTPALQQALIENARPDLLLRMLRTTLLCETAFAGLVLAAVAVLGTLEPPLNALMSVDNG